MATTTQGFKQHTINNLQYYSFKDLKSIDHDSVKGVRASNNLSEKRDNLTEGVEYLYATKSYNILPKVKAINYKKTVSMYVLVSWADAYVYKHGNMRKRVVNTINQENIDSNTQLDSKYKLIDLAASELCKDDTGKVYKVELRGERSYDKCFYRAIDLAIAFDHDRYVDYVQSEKSPYREGEDYIIINVPREINGKITIKREVFMTTAGYLIGIVRCRDQGAAIHLFRWMQKVFYAAVAGTAEQRAKMMKSIAGLSYKEIREHMRGVYGPICAIYLVKLVDTPATRAALEIDDSIMEVGDEIYKVGKSIDAINRHGQHEGGYGKRGIDDVTIEAIFVVDYSLLSRAESDILDFFAARGMKHSSDKDTEIVIIPKKCLSNIKNTIARKADLYQPKHINYVHHIESLQQKVEDMAKVHRAEIDKLKAELVAKDEKITGLVNTHKAELVMRDEKIISMSTIHSYQLKEKDAAIAKLTRKLAKQRK